MEDKGKTSDGFFTNLANSVTSLISLVPRVAELVTGFVTSVIATVSDAVTDALEFVNKSLRELADRLDQAFS